MKFKEAYRLMREDKKVKLPSWSGFWCWDKNKESIIMHTKDGEVLDIRDTKNVGYTLSNILSDDWEEAIPMNTPIIGGSLAMSFETALMLMKCRKRPMRRTSWEDGTYVIKWDSSEGPKLKKTTAKSCSFRVYTPTQEDMFTNDWTYYTEGEKTNEDTR